MSSAPVSSTVDTQPKSEAEKPAADESQSAGSKGPVEKPAPETVEEIGGPKGPEPTRYGDWEKGGRCSDF